MKIFSFKTVGYAILAYALISFGLANTGVVASTGPSWYNLLS